MWIFVSLFADVRCLTHFHQHCFGFFKISTYTTKRFRNSNIHIFEKGFVFLKKKPEITKTRPTNPGTCFSWKNIKRHRVLSPELVFEATCLRTPPASPIWFISHIWSYTCINDSCELLKALFIYKLLWTSFLWHIYLNPR